MLFLHKCVHRHHQNDYAFVGTTPTEEGEIEVKGGTCWESHVPERPFYASLPPASPLPSRSLSVPGLPLLSLLSCPWLPPLLYSFFLPPLFFSEYDDDVDFSVYACLTAKWAMWQNKTARHRHCLFVLIENPKNFFHCYFSAEKKMGEEKKERENKPEIKFNRQRVWGEGVGRKNFASTYLKVQRRCWGDA